MPANAANPAGGTMHAPGTPVLGQDVLQKFVDECNTSTPPDDGKGNKKSCTKLGADKHECCEKKIKEHQDANPPKGKPPLEGEQGYRRPELDANNNPVRPIAPAMPTGGARPNLGAAFAQGGAAVGQAFAALKGNCFPDAAIINPDGSKTFVDFKFPCPPGHPSGKGTSRGGTRTAMDPRQQGSYDALGEACGNGQALTMLPR
jgi:hypothetical protein